MEILIKNLFILALFTVAVFFGITAFRFKKTAGSKNRYLKVNMAVMGSSFIMIVLFNSIIFYNESIDLKMNFGFVLMIISSLLTIRVKNE